MLIRVKNKDTLLLDDFIFHCAVGKSGTKFNKKEGDFYTPRGIFGIKKLYYRADRIKKPFTKIICKKIKKNMGWCNDPNSNFYNKEIKKNIKIKYEELYRNDHKYDYFILIKYNFKKTIKNKGSAIFLHLTKNYKPTAGCIAISKKDFLILLKLINKNTKINID